MPRSEEQKARHAEYMREYAKRGGNGTCTHPDGCPRPMYGRSGLCAMHYQRRRLFGDVGEATPKFRIGYTLQAMWEECVNRDGAIPEYAPHLGCCWEWMCGTFASGHGRIKDGKKDRGAHVVGYELLVGPVPEGLELDHLCRVRHCVRPSHLEPVPKAVNVLRGESFTAVYARRTHCKHGHEYTDENTRPRPSGGRLCRTCLSIARHERYLRTGK